MDAANRMLTNSFLGGKKLKATLPFWKVLRKGVLHGIPDDMTIPEVIKLINAENPKSKATEGE